MPVDELILESDLTQTIDTASVTDTEELEIFSEVAMDLLLRVPVEIELI